MLLALASITGPLVDLATNLIGSLGLAGIVILNTMTGVIGVPGTEPTMLFAGFNVYDGHLTLLGIIVAGVAGDMLGACIAYTIGFFGRRELLERQGSKLHVNPRKLERAQRWSEAHGAPVIAVSRCIPFARAVFPYAAGVAEMPFVRFAISALVGSIVWITGLGSPRARGRQQLEQLAPPPRVRGLRGGGGDRRRDRLLPVQAARARAR